MATPDFVLSLREKIGNESLWLSGITAVVIREPVGEAAVVDVLMVKRADNGAWTPVTGIIDPGEEPAVAAAREVLEEADIVAVPERLARVAAVPEITYANGDRAAYIDFAFRCRYVSGEPAPADGENTEARWYPADALPPMSADMAERVAVALTDEHEARFRL